MSQDHVALSAERVAFRERYNVKLVAGSQLGANLRRLPEGVYGFTGAPAFEEIPVFAKPVYQCFEVLKPAGGDLVFVGYLSERDQHTLQNALEPANVRLFPEPYGDATKLVAVPASRIDRAKPPSRDQGNWMTLELAPKPEFLGMSSTAN